MSVDKFNGVSLSSIGIIDGVRKELIDNLNGVTVPSSVAVHTDDLWLDIRPQDWVSGTTVPGRVGSRDATLYSGALVTTTPSGETAFFTDGSDDAVHYRITSSSDKPSTGFPFTAEAWLYRDDDEGPVSEYLVGKPHNSRYRIFDMKVITSANSSFSTDGRRFFSRFYTNEATDGDNTFDAAGQLRGANPNGNIIGNSTSSYADKLESAEVGFNDTTNDTWYHVTTCWYEDSGGKLLQDVWINGVLVQEGAYYTNSSSGITDAAWPWEGTVNSTSPMSWGYGYTDRFTSSDIYRNQYAGEFRMYTKKLTTAQVLGNFNATKSNYGY